MYAKDVINATCEKSISDKNGYDIDSTYLKKTGDAQNNTVTFETDDNVLATMESTTQNPSGTLIGYETQDKKWHIMHPLDIKDKLSVMIGKITTLFHNVRFLYELCGKNDISKISDGTLTGAINSLNTGIENVSYIKYINFGVYDHTTTTVDDSVKDIFNKMPLAKYSMIFGQFGNAQVFKIIIQSFDNRDYASAIVFSYATSGIWFYKKVGGIVYKLTTNWTETVV